MNGTTHRRYPRLSDARYHRSHRGRRAGSVPTAAGDQPPVNSGGGGALAEMETVAEVGQPRWLSGVPGRPNALLRQPDQRRDRQQVRGAERLCRGTIHTTIADALLQRLRQRGRDFRHRLDEQLYGLPLRPDLRCRHRHARRRAHRQLHAKRFRLGFRSRRDQRPHPP